MTMFLSGIASIPMEYVSEDGMRVYLTEENNKQLASSARGTNFVMNHMELDVEDVRGSNIYGELTEDGRFYYESLIDDYTCEQEIIRLDGVGKIPNVSILAHPTANANITLDEERSTEDAPVYTADDWELLHLSLVSRGECTDKHGCGVLDFRLLNSGVKGSPQCPKTKVSRSKSMTDGNENGSDALLNVISERNDEIAELKLKLSGVSDTKETLDNELAELRAYKAEQERIASETRQAEMDAIKTQIKHINPDADLDDVNDISALKLALSAYSASGKPKGKFTGNYNSNDTDEPTSGQLALKNAYRAREEKFRGRVGMRKGTKERFGIKE